jgi:hypothetical protein
LSWCIAAQGHETDPDCNDYLTSKWLGLIRPLVAGFHSPLTPKPRQIALSKYQQMESETGWHTPFFAMTEQCRGRAG